MKKIIILIVGLLFITLSFSVMNLLIYPEDVNFGIKKQNGLFNYGVNYNFIGKKFNFMLGKEIQIDSFNIDLYYSNLNNYNEMLREKGFNINFVYEKNDYNSTSINIFLGNIEGYDKSYYMQFSDERILLYNYFYDILLTSDYSFGRVNNDNLFKLRYDLKVNFFDWKNYFTINYMFSKNELINYRLEDMLFTYKGDYLDNFIIKFKTFYNLRIFERSPNIILGNIYIPFLFQASTVMNTDFIDELLYEYGTGVFLDLGDYDLRFDILVNKDFDYKLNLYTSNIYF